MKVKINGKEENFEGENSIDCFIKVKGLNSDSIVVEYNYNVLPKEKWNSTVMCDGDNIEIVSFVGGG